MNDLLQAARVIYFRHKERGLVGNPDPMLAAVLALGEGDRLAKVAALAAEWHKDNDAHLNRYGQHHPADVGTMADLLEAALRGEGVK